MTIWELLLFMVNKMKWGLICYEWCHVVKELDLYIYVSEDGIFVYSCSVRYKWWWVKIGRIENDKVENYSITQSFNKQENWTKALKYTLCNLKWTLYWFVGSTNFQSLSAMVSSPAEVPSVGSLYAKRGPDSKSIARNSSNTW